MAAHPEQPMRRVVVAQDDRLIRELLTVNLEAMGLEVFTCMDGDTARTLARTAAPDLIVLDAMMPGRDGLDVLASLKNHPSTKDIPVMMVSACATDEHRAAGWRLGAEYYLAKPLDLDELLSCVDDAFGRPSLS
jgi:DNA-binding response OmpR family regulator